MLSRFEIAKDTVQELTESIPETPLSQGRFHTAVCSVYFLEPDGRELVLAATVGLKPESIGLVRMRPGTPEPGSAVSPRLPTRN